MGLGRRSACRRPDGDSSLPVRQESRVGADRDARSLGAHVRNACRPVRGRVPIKRGSRRSDPSPRLEGERRREILAGLEARIAVSARPCRALPKAHQQSPSTSTAKLPPVVQGRRSPARRDRSQRRASCGSGRRANVGGHPRKAERSRDDASASRRAPRSSRCRQTREGAAATNWRRLSDEQSVRDVTRPFMVMKGHQPPGRTDVSVHA